MKKNFWFIAIHDKMISLYHVTITHLVYKFIRNGNFGKMGLFCIFCVFKINDNIFSVIHFLDLSFLQNIAIISNREPNIVYRIES